MKLHKLNRVHKICFLQHFATGPVWYMDGRGPLATKLSRFVPLSNEDVRILDALCRNEERFEAHTDIVCQGDVPGSAFVLTRGKAFRYRLMPDGKRQILTFMIPGDIFGLHAFLLRAMDHSIATLVPTRIATISRATVFDLTAISGEAELRARRQREIGMLRHCCEISQHHRCRWYKRWGSALGCAGSKGMRPGSIEFDPVLADEILERLADGDSLASICCDEEMPDERSVRRWARNHGDGGWQESRITRARRMKEISASYQNSTGLLL